MNFELLLIMVRFIPTSSSAVQPVHRTQPAGATAPERYARSTSGVHNLDACQIDRGDLAPPCCYSAAAAFGVREDRDIRITVLLLWRELGDEKIEEGTETIGCGGGDDRFPSSYYLERDYCLSGLISERARKPPDFSFGFSFGFSFRHLSKHFGGGITKKPGTFNDFASCSCSPGR